MNVGVNGPQTEQHLKWYVENGGPILCLKSHWLPRMISQLTRNIPNIFVDLCLRTKEPWCVDKFSPAIICLIGAFAHSDFNFRTRIQVKLSEYHMLADSDGMNRMSAVFDSQFGLSSFTSRLQTMGRADLDALVEILCQTTSVSVLRFLMEAGLDVDHPRHVHKHDHFRRPLLGRVAAAGRLDVVMLLLEAGANCAFAVPAFLDDSDRLADAIFKEILQALLNGVKSQPSASDGRGAVLVIMESRRALTFCPEAPEILLDKGLFDHI